MRNSVPSSLPNAPHKALKISGETVSRSGEARHQRIVVGAEHRALVGKLMDRTFHHCGLTKKEAAGAMGYVMESGEVDQSPITRWCAGIEPPPMARLVGVPEICYGLLVALAEMHDAAEVHTVVKVKRLA